ncbi:MAG: HAD family hydrolase [Streptosporangiaceae bacterium]|jgi:HAD superfamily hydrolase (TIGR01490 family)|nr:HAD-IB family hydrolase [Actinomycetota bacterium]
MRRLRGGLPSAGHRAVNPADQGLPGTSGPSHAADPAEPPEEPGQSPSLARRLAGGIRRNRDAVAGAAAAAAADVERTPAVPDPLAGAFFDVDNTLMRGASIYHFARGLAARKMFGPRDLVRLSWSQLAFRLRGTENSGHIDAARDAALAFVAGLRVSDVVRLGEEIYDETMADRIWAGTSELTRRHLEAGQRVWLVTATPVELANILARRLGLTGALGTVAETVDGVYTGRLVGGLLHGNAKAAAIQALADREGLDLSRCSAYSDSANDLPMLLLVGHPSVVNPDFQLRGEARRRDWPVYDFRSGRRATMIALPVAAGAGALAGGMAAGVALHRRRAAS